MADISNTGYLRFLFRPFPRCLSVKHGNFVSTAYCFNKFFSSIFFFFFYFAWTRERTTCWANVSLIQLRQRYVLILQWPISAMIRVFNVWQNRVLGGLQNKPTWLLSTRRHSTKSVHLITQLLQLMRSHRGIPIEPLGSSHSPRMDRTKKILPTEERLPGQQKWQVKNIASHKSFFVTFFKWKFWFWPELYISNSGIFLSSPEVTWLLLVFP